LEDLWSAKGKFALALKKSGSTAGPFSYGDTVERHVFTLVEACNQLPVVQVAAGNEHTLILTEGGDLYSSGYNEIASSSASGGSVSQAPIQVSGAANAAANNNGPNPVNQ